MKEADLPWNDAIALIAYRISQVKAALVEDDDFNVRHMFKREWYIREIWLPAGVTFIGRVHLVGHVVKLISGKVMLVTEKGRIMKIAPDVIHTQPGFQTVAETVTEVIAQSWHLNTDGCRDIDKLEQTYFGAPAAVLKRGAELEQEIAKWQAQLQQPSPQQPQLPA